MALPSAKKPEWFDEVDDFGLAPTASNRARGYNLKDYFFEGMAEWYKSLSKQRKQTLMKRELVERARSQCKSLKIPYYGLPRTWLKILHDDYKVSFKHVPKLEKYKQKARKLLARAVVLERVTPAVMNKKLAEMRKGEIDPQVLVHETRDLIRKPAKAWKDPKRDELEFVDLSKEPPPLWWFEAYAQGLPVKRTLHSTLSKDKKALIAYYHYSRGEEGQQYYIDLFQHRF